MSGVSIICFAASYAVALALEVSRLLFRSGVRGVILVGFAAAGMVAHTAFLYYRAVNARGAPLSSEQDWYLLAAWVLVGVYLHLVYYHPRVPFGLFLLPLALGLIGAATFLADRTPLAREPASKVWGAIHSTSIVAGTVAVLVGFVAGLMYLAHARRLKLKRPPSARLRLPSLEWLQRANSRAIVVAVLMLGVGVASGMVLNLINTRSGAARVPWNDPVVLSTTLTFLWLLAAVVLARFYRPARQGRKVAYLTLAGFVFLMIALAVGLFANSRHWGEGRGAKGEGRGASTKYQVLSTEYRVLSTEYRVWSDGIPCDASESSQSTPHGVRNFQFSIFSSQFSISPRPSALRPLPSAFRPLPSAFRPLPSALCPPPSALCLLSPPPGGSA